MRIAFRQIFALWSKRLPLTRTKLADLRRHAVREDIVSQPRESLALFTEAVNARKERRRAAGVRRGNVEGLTWLPCAANSDIRERRKHFSIVALGLFSRERQVIRQAPLAVFRTEHALPTARCQSD